MAPACAAGSKIHSSTLFGCTNKMPLALITTKRFCLTVLFDFWVGETAATGENTRVCFGARHEDGRPQAALLSPDARTNLAHRRPFILILGSHLSHMILHCRTSETTTTAVPPDPCVADTHAKRTQSILLYGHIRMRGGSLRCRCCVLLRDVCCCLLVCTGDWDHLHA